AIEGLGPPPGISKPASAAARMLQWVREMQALARRHPKPYATLDEAVARMREANPHLSAELARHLTANGVIRHEDGTYRWKFDNFVRAVSPYLFNLDEAREIWGHITCPVLLVRGRESWAPDPEVDGRVQAFGRARVVTIDRAGHWVHHDQLAAFLSHVRACLAMLAIVAIACGTPQSAVRIETQAYLERSKGWAPIEAETARTIERIFDTQFVDEAEVLRQIADSRPRVLA